MPPSPVEELALLDLDRSNKGASKQRRDQINAEIAIMRDLLPLPETARQRLSQLQIMSLSCVYIRKCNVLQKLFRNQPADRDVPTMCDFFQALTGFLLITTREGKLVYISENVTDYLGHSMVDMKTQGDSLYDIVDKRDHGTVQAQLLQQGGAEVDVTRDVAFFCRMNMSRTLKRQAGFGDVKVMHVRGHFIPLSDPEQVGKELHLSSTQHGRYVFMATCSPLITPELKESLVQSNTMIFKTVHGLDMNYMEVTKTAEYHLGYTTEELCQKSWYAMLHPEDIHEAREKHILLIRSSHEMGCMMTVRMLTAAGAPLWVNIVMHVRQAASAQSDDPLIICINQVISEDEAYQIRMQSHMFTLYPPRTGDMWVPGSTSLPQQPQPENLWTSAPSTMSSGYQSPATSYFMSGPPLQQQQHNGAMPVCTSSSTAYPPLPDSGFLHHLHPHHLNASSSSTPSSSSASNASPPCAIPQLSPRGGGNQTQDKLKDMLKRKLQAPCRPAKVPKLIWDEPSMGSLEYVATADSMHSPDAASHLSMAGPGSSSGGVSYCWPVGQSTQMVSLAQYRTAHVVTEQHRVKTSLLPQAALSLPSALSPQFSSLPEQVVPESAVLPESYLTPDPSPASSPEPHSLLATAAVKTEAVRAPRPTPASAAILQELEKLASLSRNDSVPPKNKSSMPLPKAIKTEKSNLDCQQKPVRKELPVMDAFDIESFFDTLTTPCQARAMLDTKRTELVSALKVPHGSAPKSSATVRPQQQEQSLPIKQEPEDIEVSLPRMQQPELPCQLTVLPVKKVQEIRSQPALEMNQHEMEELLSFFSGDMTATQIDLSEALLGSNLEDEGDMLVESARKLGQGHSMPCEMSGFMSCWERPMEGFSPGSSGSDVTSDLSSDEDASCGEESYKSYVTPAVIQDDRLRPSPLPTIPRPTAHPRTPQAVPGLHEEDELYQLDKLLSTMASDSGILLSSEPQ